VRAVACGLLIFCVSFSLTGCALFGSKSKTGGGSTPSVADQKPPADLTSDPLAAPSSLEQEQGSYLAGSLFDEYGERPGRAYIRCVSMEEGERKAAPIEIESQPGGVFTIAGLKRGQRYKLVVRSEANGKVIAGNFYATVPNPNIVIHLSEDFVTKETPPLPYAPPTLPKPIKLEVNPGKVEEDPLKGSGKINQSSGNTFELPRPEFQPGFPGNDKPPANQGTLPPWDNSGSKQFPENFAAIEPNNRMGVPLRTNPLPNPGKPEESPSSIPVTPVPSTPVEPRAGVQVPACVVVGKKVVNLALYDLYGNPWEWKVHRKGKLVLLDFWSPNCIPCLASIPTLRQLQQKYGPYGLEILAVAAPSPGSLEVQKNNIRRIGSLQQTNYRLLLGNEPGNPVLDQFRVKGLPTMFLIDEASDIMMFHEGALTGNDLRYLEQEIRQKLNVPKQVPLSY
jgi:thiol-disulfide isomerase/thioredoxin